MYTIRNKKKTGHVKQLLWKIKKSTILFAYQKSIKCRIYYFRQNENR